MTRRQRRFHLLIWMVIALAIAGTLAVAIDDKRRIEAAAEKRT